MQRLLQQMEFLIEADKLKTIVRRNYISDGSKRENDAEHSWYFALAAMTLSEYANGEVDVQKVIKMSIIHDLVEIYAGDTFIYDEKGKESQQEREQIASEKIFGLLPEDQKGYYLELWNEFEGNKTNESKFARAVDRIVPVLLNMKSNGLGWKENKIGYTQVFEVSSRIANGSSTLWRYMKEILEENQNSGIFYTRELHE